MPGDLDPVEQATRWRPQQFGRRGLRAVRDPIVEPFWQGPRVLAAVTPDTAALVHDGQLLAAPEALRSALRIAARADALVAEGTLTAEAFATGEGAFPAPERERVRPGRLLFGGLSGRRERLAREHGDAIRAEVRAAAAVRTIFDSPVAFVATDLLWVDGEPLLDVPLLERKRLLEAVLAESELVRRTAFVRPTAGGSLLAWRSLGFAMLAWKEANSRYRPGEVNDAWTLATAPSTAARPGQRSGAGA